MMSHPKESPARRWIFPSPTRCPRCQQFDTEATHTDSERGIQYRKCRRATCRRKFSISGPPVSVETAEVPTPEVPASVLLPCPHCGKKYQRQGDLTKHIQKTHSEGETNDVGRKSEI